MATEEMFTSLPPVSSAQLTDIICAVQGYTGPSVLGLSVKETLQQVFNLFQSNIILYNSGNPNGSVAGSTYQFCWDTSNSILYLCTTTGDTSTAVWVRADINSGLTTTATSGGTTTLTLFSYYWQVFTGSSTQTVTMPLASTLQAGMTWRIVNESSGTLTVQSSGANTIVAIAPGYSSLITCVLNSGTDASSWIFSSNSGGGGSGTVSSGTANDMAYYSASGTTVSALATANNGVLVTSGGGVPSISTTLPSGLASTSMTLTTPSVTGTATMNAGAYIKLDFGTGTLSADACVINKQGMVVTTGSLTTAQYATYTFTINNSLSTAGRPVVATIDLTLGTNTTEGITIDANAGAGYITVNITNLNSASLNGSVGINVILF